MPTLVKVTQDGRKLEVVGLAILLDGQLEAFELIEVKLIAAPLVLLEQVCDLRMPHRLAGVVGQQILFRNVSHVLGFFVLSKQVIKWLIFVRSNFRGN